MKLRTAALIVEATSLPLLFIVGLMLITGYASVSSVGAERAFISKSLAVGIHTSPVTRFLLVSLLILHTYAGTELLRAKMDGKKGVVLEYSVMAFLVYLTWVFLPIP